MAAVVKRRGVASTLAALVAFVFVAPNAHALEAFDGMIEAHGFAEMQVRSLNRDFQEEFDLAQWYNVINVEVEFDFLPDGWGPFDLLQGYARIEGRYDCIYSAGCGVLPNAKVYGNSSNDLPLRLRDAVDSDYGGAIDANETVDPAGIVFRISPVDRNPVGWGEIEVIDNEISVGSAEIVNRRIYTPQLYPGHPLVPFLELNPRCPVTRVTDSIDDPDDPTDAPGCVDNRRLKTVVRKREAFPGFDTLFDTKGADAQLGENQDFATLGVSFYNPDLTSMPVAVGGSAAKNAAYRPHFRGLSDLRDDPGFYTLNPVIDWKFAMRSFPGSEPNGTTLPMGPWLPTNTWGTLAALRDRAHPMRGRLTPVGLTIDGVVLRTSGERLHERDCDFSSVSGPVHPDCFTNTFAPDPLDPRLAKLEDMLVQMIDDNVGLITHNLANNQILGRLPGPNNGLFNGVKGLTPFGGDYSGIIPCYDTPRAVDGRNPNFVGPPVDSTDVDQLEGLLVGSRSEARRGCIPFTNVRVTGGGGELPMRAAPDLSNLALLTGDGFDAQGIFIPNPGLLKYARNGGNFDNHQFNFTETDRAFNHGASQSDTYELKEGYLDMEFLDSRLWIRAGLQNIVWGKTELFRTTDQFNPQDYALASLPALEESRIALLSWRAVYSLYDVGPLEDVRLEFAMNFDRVKPADLGACGEPYTPDIVCGLTLGSAIHGVTGIGVAAYDRPPNGWDDVDGLEFGGRIEFRWDRFSFAIVDFYGYNDFPYPEPIFFYERNVDPSTGMPRKADSRGRCGNRAAFTVANGSFPWAGAGRTVIHAGNSYEEATLRNARLSNGTPTYDVGGNLDDGPSDAERQLSPTGFETGGGADDDWWRRKEAYTLFGIGTDDDCLKPGGAPGRANENRFDARLAADPDAFSEYSKLDGTIDADTYVGSTIDAAGALGTPGTALQWTREGFSEDYALAYHSGNQQLFQFICSGTVTIAVAIAPEACAWNLWGSDTLLINDAGGPPFSEVFGTLFAGDRQFVGPGFNSFYVIAMSRLKSDVPDEFNDSTNQWGVATLNSDVRDGRTGATDNLYNRRADEGFFGIRLKDQARDVFDAMTLDNSLTWQQRALLGCGPAYGTRCDSGAAAVRVEILSCNQASLDCQPMEDAASLIGLIDIENETVARQYPARYAMRKNPDTCDPMVDPDQCICPPANPDECRLWGRGGGIDFLNAEASVIVQSFSGFDGTGGRTNTDYEVDTWVTWAKDTPQPGTIGVSRVIDAGGIVTQEHEAFGGGVVCSRYDPGNAQADRSGLVKLPGCRGAVSATVDKRTLSIEVEFDPFYSPHVDGCMFGHSMTDKNDDTYYVKAMRRNSAGMLEADNELQGELFQTCFNNNAALLADPDSDGDPGAGVPDKMRANPHAGDPTWFSYTRRRSANVLDLNSGPVLGAGTLFHPLAQCEEAGDARDGAPVTDVWNALPGSTDPSAPDYEFSQSRLNGVISLCMTLNRDFDNDFINGNAQVFRNELAAVSYNIQTFLTVTSCNDVSGDDDLDVRDCYDPNRPYAVSRCSHSAPHFCRNVKGFLGVAGLSRNDPRAGGNENFGRRDFIWHSGGDVALKYQRRNVFGVSADFAEDVSKTNWGVEFTWIGETPWGDNNSLSNTTLSDTFNLTVSIDRPTFINFLNANRTFFFNTQWFFNYIPKHGPGFTSFKNDFNVLFTFAVFTGYYQDRFLPQLVTVYDFGSGSGGFLPQLQYRFTEAFSVTFGVTFFIGKSEFVPMPVRGFAPDFNRAGPNAYNDGVTRLLAQISRRDEAWMRLRWTF